MKYTRLSTLFTQLCIVVASLLATVALRADSKPAAPDPAVAAIEKVVLEANARMTAAANSLNADAFFEYILDSAKGVIIQNGTLFETRQEALEAVKRGFLGIAKLERQIESPQVTVVSPELALLTGEGTTHATFADGRETTTHFAVSLIFQLKDGQWKVLHGHYSTPLRM
jgi:ketosteroid isomerase-like protein